MKCLHCELDVPLHANFCPQCGNETALASIPQYVGEVPLEITAIESIGFRLVKKIPMPYWLSIILFWQLVSLGDYLLTSSYRSPKTILFYFILYTAFAGTMIIIEYANRQMQGLFPKLIGFVDAPFNDLLNWFRDQLTKTVSGRQAVISGILMTIVGTLSTYSLMAEQSGHILPMVLYRTFFIGVGFFFQGMGLWGVFSIIRMTTQLTNFKINVRLFAVGNDSVMALGNVFLGLSLALTVDYSLFVLADIIGGLYNSDIIVFWNIVAVLAILAFFVVPQYKIHRLMLNEKQARLKAFSLYLEKSVRECLQSPTKEKLDHLKGLFELREHLADMHEWSFRTRTISQLISVLLIPLLLVILEVYLSR